MNCPKCKTKLEKNVIKCPSCGVRIGRFCPKCNTYNFITNKICTECGEVLLVECPVCRSINLPNAKQCRKCGSKILSKEEKALNEIVYEAKYQTLADAKKNILTYISEPDTRVIAISGENEYGKNYVFRKLMRETSNLGIAWLMGKCTPYTQLTPLGFIQTVFLNLFNVANFCTSKKELKKESLKFFKKDFPNLSTNEIYDLLNILYPENLGEYKNIDKCEQNSIKIILKIFYTILSKMNTVLLIENIEYIDSFSYDILNILMSDDYLSTRITLIMSFTKEQSGINYFPDSELRENQYSDITIAPFTKEQIEPFFTSTKEYKFSDSLKTKIISYSKKDPVLTEQLINIIYDTKNVDSAKLFSNLQETLEYRLNLLKNDDIKAYAILIAFSILGFDFSAVMLNGFLGMDSDTIESYIIKLIKKNYIVPVSGISYEFKSLGIWKAIIDAARKDLNVFRKINQELFTICPQYILSTFATFAYITQNVAQTSQVLEAWNHCTSLAAYIGDKALYVILQKQILKILGENKIDSDELKLNLYAEIGKLLEETDPKQAVDYLSKAIVIKDESTEPLKIELLGFLASASMKLKNYHGVIECIDNVITLLPNLSETELAILKSRKLKPLLQLGNVGTLINLADNDIIPVFEKALESNQVSNIVSQDELFDMYIKTYLQLAKALSIQGSRRAFDVLQMLADTCRANKVEDNETWLNINMAYSFASTISGDIKTSTKVINDILAEDSVPEELVSKINLVTLLNRFLTNKNELTYNDLLQATQYADDVNDDFTKNILKLLLGRLVCEKTSPKDAMRIYSEQIEYFANIQNATGVLLGWYYIAKAHIDIKKTDMAIDIITKALAIAESANISNLYFEMLLNKLLGEAYIVKKDYEASRIYIEKALNIAQTQKLKYSSTQLYILYAKCLQEYAMTVQEKRTDYLLLVKTAINKAKVISDSLKITTLSNEVDKLNKNFISFCQMNGIVLQSN